MLQLLGLFTGGLSGWLKLGMLAAIVTTIGGYVWSYDSRGREIAALRTQVAVNESTITVLKANVELAKGAIQLLDAHLKASMVNLADSCAILEEIAASKDPNADQGVDGVIADVLQKLQDKP